MGNAGKHGKWRDTMTAVGTVVLAIPVLLGIVRYAATPWAETPARVQRIEEGMNDLKHDVAQIKRAIGITDSNSKITNATAQLNFSSKQQP